mgnify:CR=1 FL=1
MFVDELVVLHLIDEATRYSQAVIVQSKGDFHLLKAITNHWIRIFGRMAELISDREAALVGEEASIWGDRHGIRMSPKPKVSNAWLAERHNELIRDSYHQIRDQMKP